MAIAMVFVFAVLRVMETFTAPFYHFIAFISHRKRIPSATDPILTTSASVLAEKIRARELTCSQVVSAFIRRCKEVNPIVNAIIDERYNEALRDAEKADQFLYETREYISQSQLRNEKPLLGIPVTIKECCSMKGMKLTLGVKRRKNQKAAYNGDAVQLLIDAGAIPIAITSTPAYSTWIETFNDVIGYTSNPYDNRKACAGSSGGEAALIASAASVLGLGSDAGGSIRVPAAFCGIYGHKPSNGMVSSNGHANFSSSPQVLDMVTVGPLCRYAIDLRLAVDVLSGKRLQQNVSISTVTNLRQIRVHHLPDYERKILSVNAILRKKLLQATRYLEVEHGCFVQQVNDIAEFQNIPEIASNHFQKLLVSACKDESCIQDAGSNKIKNFAKFVEHSRLRCIWRMDDESYAEQLSNLRTKLSKLLDQDGVLLIPSWSESAFYKYQSIWKVYNVCCYEYFVNIFGFASTAVPVGLDDNQMPLSIQVVADRNREHVCFMIAEELEKLFGGWIPPYDLHN